LAFHGEAASVVVVKGQSSGRLRRPRNPGLLEQVVNHRLLLSIVPTGEQLADERERRE
jgi:hypothetical protein